MISKTRSSGPTYALVHLENFLYNLEKARYLSKSDIIPIIKANGYGHGAVPLAQYAVEKSSVSIFGVATLEEGVALRKVLPLHIDIISLGYIDPQFYDELLHHRLIMTIYDYKSAKMYHDFLKRKSTTGQVVVKLNTGMNRLGFEGDFSLMEFIKSYPLFKLKIIMSHLSSSESDTLFTEKQIGVFDNFLRRSHINISTSLFNSSAICNFSNKYSYTRPGIMLYGYVYPYNIELKKVMYVYSRIVHIKSIKKGEHVGYSDAFIAEKDMKVGIVPIGYGDGYPRVFSNKACMYMGGYKCHVIGNICMDMTMLDITAVPEVLLDNDVEVMGDNVDAMQWGEWAGTICYEVLTMLSNRVTRVYI